MTRVERFLRHVFFQPVVEAEKREERLRAARQTERDCHEATATALQSFRGTSERFAAAKADLITQDMLDLVQQMDASLHR